MLIDQPLFSASLIFNAHFVGLMPSIFAVADRLSIAYHDLLIFYFGCDNSILPTDTFSTLFKLHFASFFYFVETVTSFVFSLVMFCNSPCLDSAPTIEFTSSTPW